MSLRHSTAALKQSGSVMASVLIVLTAATLLIPVLFYTTKENFAVAVHRQLDLQKQSMATAGISYGLGLINRAGAPHSEVGGPDEGRYGINTVIEKLNYWVEPGKLGFSISIQPYGLCSRVNSKGIIIRNGRVDSLKMNGVIGQEINLAEYPTLTLLNRQGNLVLAGSAQIQGGVLLWRGTVRKSSSRKVRFNARRSRGHIGRVRDSTSKFWKRWEISTAKIDTWIKRRKSELAEHLAPNPDSIHIFPLGTYPNVSQSNKQGPLKNRKIVGKSLRFGSGTDMEYCLIAARRIVIDGTARIRNCLVFAEHIIDISGSPLLSGQFIARDSIRMNISSEFNGPSAFYVHGGLEISQSDTVYIGGMDVRRARGKAVFLFGGHGRSAAPGNAKGLYRTHLSLSGNVQMTGLVYVNGLADIRCRLTGSLACENLKFEYKGTVYLGHLKDARLSAIPPDREQKAVIKSPLVFPFARTATLIHDVPL